MSSGGSWNSWRRRRARSGVLRPAQRRKLMQRSTDRILTMHAGSLARPPDLREIVLAKSTGQPYDAAALARRLRSAVAEVVQQQIAVGLDSINDGEFSKSNFTNYARERLSGHEERSSEPGSVLA